MLEKRHSQDGIEIIKDEITELIDVLSIRKAEERFGANMATQTLGGPNSTNGG
jgi:hypothetical protein